MRRPALTGRLVAAAAVVTASLCLPAPVEAEEPVVIEHASYRRRSDSDPGTVAIFLRNASRAPVTVSEVLLDDIALPVFGVGADQAAQVNENVEKPRRPASYEEAKRRYSGKRVIWAVLAPNPIPPGDASALRIKLANRPSRPRKVTVVAGEQKVTTVVGPGKNPICISTVVFSEKLERACVYVENHGKTPLKVSRILFNGKDVSDLAWISSARIAPSEVGLAILSMPRALTAGSYVTVRIEAGRDTSAQEWVRAFSSFPIAAESGGEPQGFGLDGERTAHVFDCPIHAYAADLRRSGLEIFRRSWASAERKPALPCSVHVCRIRPEKGFALFGPTADVMRFNPYITTATSLDYEKETPESVAWKLSRLAVAGASPRVTHAVIPTYRFGAEKEFTVPEDLRRLVYSVVGAGAKGILYRHRRWKDVTPAATAVNEEIAAINRELRQLRPYLRIGHPVEWATCEGGGVDARTILAGKDTLLLLLLSRKGAEAEGVRATVRLPAWLEISKVREVTGQGETEASFSLEERGLVLELDSVEVTRQFILSR